jgi:hypothetical protein
MAGWVLNGNTLTTDDNVGIGNITPNNALHLAPGETLRVEGGTNPNDTADYFSFGGYGGLGVDAPGIPNGRFVVLNNGNVGIGNPAPSFALHLPLVKVLRIEGGQGAGDNGSYFSFGGNGSLGVDAPGIPNGRFVVLDSGNVGIGTPTPGHLLHVAGDIGVDGDVLLTGADCAEDFDIDNSESLEPGTVVVIGDNGMLHAAVTPYDKKVAGVVSGAGQYRPALILDRRAAKQERTPIALIGKVFCKVDANYSSVEVGDLLTTSETPGYAMKATEPTRAFGAVLGKVLRPLTTGRGLIPILVTLQ